MTPHAIDRIDRNGNIREHLTFGGDVTLCGVRLGMTQGPAGNARCRNCEKWAARSAIIRAAHAAAPANDIGGGQ